MHVRSRYKRITAQEAFNLIGSEESETPESDDENFPESDNNEEVVRPRLSGDADFTVDDGNLFKDQNGLTI